MADGKRASATALQSGGGMTTFARHFTRPFLIRATDRSGLVLGALAEAAESDAGLADHLLRALADAEEADPPDDYDTPAPRVVK